MKKLLALLLAALLVFSLAACGSVEKDTDEDEKDKVEEEEKDENDKSDKEDDKEDDKEKETEEPSDDEETKKPVAKDEVEYTYVMEDDGIYAEAVFVAKDDVVVSLYAKISGDNNKGDEVTEEDVLAMYEAYNLNTDPDINVTDDNFTVEFEFDDLSDPDQISDVIALSIIYIEEDAEIVYVEDAISSLEKQGFHLPGEEPEEDAEEDTNEDSEIESAKSECENCGDYSEIICYRGYDLCHDCYSNNDVCDGCGGLAPEDDLVYANGGNLYCPDCYEEEDSEEDAGASGEAFCGLCMSYMDEKDLEYNDVWDCDFCEDCAENIEEWFGTDGPDEGECLPEGYSYCFGCDDDSDLYYSEEYEGYFCEDCYNDL